MLSVLSLPDFNDPISFSPYQWKTHIVYLLLVSPFCQDKCKSSWICFVGMSDFFYVGFGAAPGVVDWTANKDD